MAGDSIHFDEFSDSQKLRAAGLDAAGVFTDSRVIAWRKLPDRENAVFEFEGIKWHVKRYWKGGENARREVAGIDLLKQNGIETVPLSAWGVLGDGRGFVISRDLAGFVAGDRLIGQGDEERILAATSIVAGRLHGAGLHHRDLYLCHFFLKMEQGETKCVLIDPARVRRLPWLFKKRWIVKDLAQFGYSLQTAGLIVGSSAFKRSEESRLKAELQTTSQADVFERWLKLYENSGGFPVKPMRNAIARKIRWIARHDAELKKSQPTRNVSIG